MPYLDLNISANKFMFHVHAWNGEHSIRFGRFEAIIFNGPYRPYPAEATKSPGETLFYLGPLTICLINWRVSDAHTCKPLLWEDD